MTDRSDSVEISERTAKHMRGTLRERKEKSPDRFYGTDQMALAELEEVLGN